MQTNLKNCPRCKKVSNIFVNAKICDNCMKEEEEIFQGVYDILREEPGLSVAALSLKTGISSKKILGYVKEGRLQILENVLSCKLCGINIEKGSLCLACNLKQREALMESIKHVSSKEKELGTEKSSATKMHTIERRKLK